MHIIKYLEKIKKTEWDDEAEKQYLALKSLLEESEK